MPMAFPSAVRPGSSQSRWEQPDRDQATPLPLPSFATQVPNEGPVEESDIARSVAAVMQADIKRMRSGIWPLVRNNMAVLLTRLEQFSPASELLNPSALSSAETQSVLLFNAANIKYSQRRYLEALQLYSSFAHASPEAAAAYVNRAACYHQLRDFDQAMGDYARALRAGADRLLLQVSWSRLLHYTTMVF